MRTLASLLLATLGLAQGPDTVWNRNNWAVVVGTSRYWYNYRHASNALGIYHALKERGFPDSHIILFIAEDYVCSPRNKFPGKIFADSGKADNLYEGHIEVDYRGEEVTVDNFLRLISGRHFPTTPRNKRLLTDENSNVLFYITGHSGMEFIKFQDWEEMTSTDIAHAFSQMHLQNRYKQLFWISDTCQAASLQNVFYSPNIIAIGSSGQNENAYSHHSDSDIGISVADRFTYYSIDWFKRRRDEKASIQDYVQSFDPVLLMSNPEMRTDLFMPRTAKTTKMSEFFTATGRVHSLSGISSIPLAKEAIWRDYSSSKVVVDLAPDEPSPFILDLPDPMGWLKLIPLVLVALVF